MSKDINRTRINLGETVKENYNNKYDDVVLHKYPMGNQICRTKILDWNYHNIKGMQKLLSLFKIHINVMTLNN